MARDQRKTMLNQSIQLLTNLAVLWLLTLQRPLVPYGYTYKPLPDWIKPSFVIFDIQALRRSALSVRVPGCQKLQMTA